MTVFGGYFVTKPVPRPEYVSSHLLPARILSLSDCICDFIPDVWAIDWTRVSPEDRMAAANKVGIQAFVLPEVIRWTTQHLDAGRFGWPCVFLALQDALDFAERFLARDGGFTLLGIALQSEAADDFLAGEAPGPSMGVPGVYKAVSKRVGLQTGGVLLGWEPLCYEYGGFHSWLCNGLETAVAEKYEIRPNEHGFITSGAEASAAAAYCGQEEVGAEPGFWAPWSVVEYPLFPGLAA